MSRTKLLNTLLRDSIVTYNTEECRFIWDDDRVDFIETGDSVAEFIASNLKVLGKEPLHILQILSCFGTQTDQSLLQILDKFHKGITESIGAFISKGISYWIEVRKWYFSFFHLSYVQHCTKLKNIYQNLAFVSVSISMMPCVKLDQL